MTNKVLIKLDIPELDRSFDIFVPVNEVVWKITSLTIKAASELTGFLSNDSSKYIFINKNTNEVYSSNMTIFDSNIRNGTELVLLRIL
ncbi:MAG: hypothetical protein IJO57_02655 [Bacilli bacterium]|nr:hypothetical protein [Bacilli bacterium]